MKSVLISIQPKWCELIAKGEKTIEVRKTRPKLQTPFKCYIYCTQSKEMLWVLEKEYRQWEKEIAQIFTAKDCGGAYRVNGKVIGEFVCDSIDTIAVYNEQLYAVEHFQKGILQQSCLTLEEMKGYLGAKNEGYGWHISDLKIYDKPKELGAFSRVCPGNYKCDSCKCWERKCYVDHQRRYNSPLKRPPLSWQYIETEVKE